jgi:hypothetical protein
VRLLPATWLVSQGHATGFLPLLARKAGNLLQNLLLI